MSFAFCGCTAASRGPVMSLSVTADGVIDAPLVEMTNDTTLHHWPLLFQNKSVQHCVPAGNNQLIHFLNTYGLCCSILYLYYTMFVGCRQSLMHMRNRSVCSLSRASVWSSSQRERDGGCAQSRLSVYESSSMCVPETPSCTATTTPLCVFCPIEI